MRRQTEYGLFNILPIGETLDDIPEALRWLYEHPFQTDYSYKALARRRDEINRSREREMYRKDYRGEVKTYCEVRQRIIVYGPWSKAESDSTANAA